MTTAPARVTIVLPVRNGEQFLVESLESVLQQTMRDWELVAVDDGSSDATPLILAEYCARDTRIRVLRNDPSRRLPGALNRGFEVARGALWTWTSDDNAYRPEALATMVAALDREPGVDVVYANYTKIDSEGRDIDRCSVPDVSHLGYSNIVGPCFLYRREVGTSVGPYTEDLFLAEDYDFWLRATVRHRFRRLDADLYRYRVHGASLGASRRDEVRDATAAALRRNLPHLPRALRYQALTRLEHLALAACDPGEARARRRQAFRIAPMASIRRMLGAWLRPGSPQS